MHCPCGQCQPAQAVAWGGGGVSAGRTGGWYSRPYRHRCARAMAQNSGKRGNCGHSAELLPSESSLPGASESASSEEESAVTVYQTDATGVPEWG
jgi:hypothetical protein